MYDTHGHFDPDEEDDSEMASKLNSDAEVYNSTRDETFESSR
jgi:hypothetical protein